MHVQGCSHWNIFSLSYGFLRLTWNVVPHEFLIDSLAIPRPFLQKLGKNLLVIFKTDSYQTGHTQICTEHMNQCKNKTADRTSCEKINVLNPCQERHWWTVFTNTTLLCHSQQEKKSFTLEQSVLLHVRHGEGSPELQNAGWWSPTFPNKHLIPCFYAFLGHPRVTKPSIKETRKNMKSISSLTWTHLHLRMNFRKSQCTLTIHNHDTNNYLLLPPSQSNLPGRNK